MNTLFYNSSDGAKIAYQRFGSGPAIILAHAGGRDKSMWLNSSWVEALTKYFTVVIPDMRGCGESDKSYNPDFYAIDKILADISGIIGECGFKEYMYYGHSYGATIGLQACKQINGIKKAVCAGSCFGDHFFRRTVPEWICEYERVGRLKKENRLKELEWPEEEVEWAEQADLDLMLAQFRAWTAWPGIEPGDIKTDLAVYTGTDDHEEILTHLNMRASEMRRYNIRFKIFDGLNHFELVKELDVVYPWVIEFLLG